MTSLHLIHELVEHWYDYVELLNAVEWIVLPMVNPDGYVRTHNDNRFWRKTNSTNPGTSCVGTDLKSNFDFEWGISGSTQPCNVHFIGSSAFSEPESRAIRDVLIEYRERIAVYISLQAFGNQIIYPPFASLTPPENLAELDGLANAIASAVIEAGQGPYRVGQASDVLSIWGGSNMDYAYSVQNIPMAFWWYVTDDYGVELPEDKIEDFVSQTFPGFLVVGDYVMDNIVKK